MVKSYRILNYVHICKFIVNIAYDKEIENLVEIDDAIDKIVEMTVQGVGDQKKLFLKQEFIDEDENTIHEVFDYNF